MKKKTILFMAQLPPPVHGASLRNKSLLDSPLLNDEFEMISLPLKFIDDMKDLGKVSPRKLFLMFIHAWRMICIFFSRKIDLVYFTMSPSGGAFYRDILFILIIKIFRRKRLLHFRMKGLQHTARSKFGRALIKFAFRGSDIVCLSRHHTLDMAGLAYREPYIVPNGIKVEKEFLYLSENRDRDPAGVTRLLFLSNLSIKKGVGDLIEAAAMLIARGYDFEVSIVGNEWHLTFSEVQEMIDKNDLQEVVKLEGPKFGKDKFECIANADVFVFPTHFELFPGVILEAMQFEKAIVSTFEGSIPDMIDNHINGLLVEQRNTTQLADAIAFMIDHPLKRQEMARLAKQKFFEQFTFEAFERNMKDVFHHVIAK